MRLLQRLIFYVGYSLMRLNQRRYFLWKAKKYHYDSKEARKYYYLSSKEIQKNNIFNTDDRNLRILEKCFIELEGIPVTIFRKICKDRGLSEDLY